MKEHEYIRCPATEYTEVLFDGNIALFQAEAGEYCHFNQSASDLWRWLMTPQSIHSLSQRLAEKYQYDLDSCTSDVTTWVADLASKKLVNMINTSTTNHCPTMVDF